MNSVDSHPLPKTKQLAFQINYIWTALGFALFAGFAIGAHLTFVIGYDFNLGDGFEGLIQTHGHQLVGWARLFIMGMSSILCLGLTDAVFEIVTGIAFVTGRHFIHLNDAIRHIYLLGFVTNLILGMSVRMIPGFIYKKKAAFDGSYKKRLCIIGDLWNFRSPFFVD